MHSNQTKLMKSKTGPTTLHTQPKIPLQSLLYGDQKSINENADNISGLLNRIRYSKHCIYLVNVIINELHFRYYKCSGT